MSFNIIISSKICMTSSWENGNLHKYNWLPTNEKWLQCCNKISVSNNKKPTLRFSGTRIHLKYLSKQLSFKLICIKPIWPLTNVKWFISKTNSHFLIIKNCILRAFGAKAHYECLSKQLFLLT